MTGRCDICLRPRRDCPEPDDVDCLRRAVEARDAHIVELDREIERLRTEANYADDQSYWTWQYTRDR